MPRRSTRWIASPGRLPEQATGYKQPLNRWEPRLPISPSECPAVLVETTWQWWRVPSLPSIRSLELLPLGCQAVHQNLLREHLSLPPIPSDRARSTRLFLDPTVAG